MMAGVVAASRPASQISMTPWTPLNMVVVPQIYLDMDASVITDVGGFASSVSNLGALGTNGNFSQSATAQRPAIYEGGAPNGKRAIRFDGVNDVLTCNTENALAIHRNVPVAWSFDVVFKRAVDTSGSGGRLVFDSRTGTGAGRFGTLCNTNAAGDQNKPAVQWQRLDADTISAVRAASASPLGYEMRFMVVDYAGGSASIHINGSVSATATISGTPGNTSNTSASMPLAVGAYNTGIAPADIDLATMVVGNSGLAQQEIDRLFGWAAHKYGLTANLPADHPYKTIAPTV